MNINIKIEHCHENTPEEEHAEFKGLTRVDLQPQTSREEKKRKIMNSLILDADQVNKLGHPKSPRSIEEGFV